MVGIHTILLACFMVPLSCWEKAYMKCSDYFFLPEAGNKFFCNREQPEQTSVLRLMLIWSFVFRKPFDLDTFNLHSEISKPKNTNVPNHFIQTEQAKWRLNKEIFVCTSLSQSSKDPWCIFKQQRIIQMEPDTAEMACKTRVQKTGFSRCLLWAQRCSAKWE